MFMEYEALDKKGIEANKLFSEFMKKKFKGKKIAGPCWRNLDLSFYSIENNEIYVAESPIYRNRPTSLIIYGKNQKEICMLKKNLEKGAELKLKLIRKGKSLSEKIE
jgi:hypothetical protein